MAELISVTVGKAFVCPGAKYRTFPLETLEGRVVAFFQFEATNDSNFVVWMRKWGLPGQIGQDIVIEDSISDSFTAAVRDLGKQYGFDVAVE